jgi:hypothetical protein
MMEEEATTEAATDEAPVLRMLTLTPPTDERWTASELAMGFDN